MMNFQRMILSFILSASLCPAVCFAAIEKLPDEPADGPAASQKPAMTENSAEIKAITARLDEMLIPYKPLQRSMEPIYNVDLSPNVIMAWRLIYVKPFDKTGKDKTAEKEAGETAADGSKDMKEAPAKEDFAAITLIPVDSIRLSNALKLRSVGRPDEEILQPLFFTKYGIMWRKVQTQYETFTLYLGATKEFHVFASANIGVIYSMFRHIDMKGGADLISLLVDCLDIEDDDYFTNRFALVHLAEFGDASVPALQRSVKRIAALGQPPLQQFLGLTNIASEATFNLLNEASDSKDETMRKAVFTALIAMPTVRKEVKHAYIRMVETRENIWAGYAACDTLGCGKDVSGLVDTYYAKPKSIAEFETVARIRWLLRDPKTKFTLTPALNEITIASIRSGEIANSPQYLDLTENESTRNARLRVEDEKRIADAKKAILTSPHTDLAVAAGIELAMFLTKDKRVSKKYIARVNSVGIDILRGLPRQQTLQIIDTLIRYNESIPEAEKLTDIRARIGK